MYMYIYNKCINVYVSLFPVVCARVTTHELRLASCTRLTASWCIHICVYIYIYFFLFAGMCWPKNSTPTSHLIDSRILVPYFHTDTRPETAKKQSSELMGIQITPRRTARSVNKYGPSPILKKKILYSSNAILLMALGGPGALAIWYSKYRRWTQDWFVIARNLDKNESGWRGMVWDS